MSTARKSTAEKRLSMSAKEWAARQDLACAYRLFDHFNWHGLIFNHITLRVPGEDNHFLINPFGLMYREVNASNLVKIDCDGNILGDSDYPVNRAGFVIHSAIHMTREDAHAVMHTHTTDGVAVGAQEHGLLPLSMPAIGMQGQVGQAGAASQGKTQQGGEAVGAAELLWQAMTRWMIDKDPSFLE